MTEALVLIGLAAHRLWLLWHQSEIFRPAREWMVSKGGRLGYFSSCAMCTATWAGAIMTGLWQVWPLDLIVWACAATSVIGVVDAVNAILGRKATGQ